MALGYAAIALAILAIFLPLVMVVKVRQQATDQHYQVTGGNMALILTGLVGFLIISAQIFYHARCVTRTGLKGNLKHNLGRILMYSPYFYATE